MKPLRPTEQNARSGVLQWGNDFGLVRIEGDDNLLADNRIHSEGGVDHLLVTVTGTANRLQGLQISADSALSAKIHISAGTAGRENQVLECADAGEVSFSPDISVIFRPLPAATVA